MLESIAKGLAKVFGTKSDRDIKTLSPVVALVNTAFAKLADISDDELRNETTKIKEIINEDLKSFDDRISELRKEIDQLNPEEVQAKDALFNQIDAVEKERDEALEVSLEKVLPRAFAVVKETARRLKENGKLTVTANLQDQTMAASKSYVEIDGDQATWNNTWTAAGVEVTWEMIHYDV